MTNELIDNLDATGHGGKPIVMGKEPVKKPEVMRGRIGISSDLVTKVHDDAAITFALRDKGDPDADCIVTYHRVELTGDKSAPGTMVVMVLPTTVVTWEWVAKA